MTIEELRHGSAAFLQLLTRHSPVELTDRADDLLLFLYRVRDAFPSIRLAGFDRILHALEADPDGLFASEDRRRLLTDILRRLSTAR